MSAAVTAAIPTGHQVEFRKYTVIFFLVIVNPFDEFAAPVRERVLLFQSDQPIQFNQAFITQTSVKSIRQE